jgi:hypothetical protein
MQEINASVKVKSSYSPERKCDNAMVTKRGQNDSGPHSSISGMGKHWVTETNNKEGA